MAASSQEEVHRGRPSGALLAMPLLMLNLGTEMIYILAHRLDAQKVGDVKSARVLGDVAMAIFHKDFLEELFRPQEMYSRHSARSIFDKLAHSSIMRLNKTSMDKLYDLMTMSFKYQIMQCVAPEQLYAVTARHLLNAMSLVEKDSKAAECVGIAVEMLRRTYEPLPLGEWFRCRQQLLNFFEGRKVRVSIFLQSEAQSTEGDIMIPIAGMLPRGGAPPGTVSYLDPKGDGREAARTSHFPTPLAFDCREFSGYDDEGNKLAPGHNMYMRGKDIDVVALLRAAAANRTGPTLSGGDWAGGGEYPPLGSDGAKGSGGGGGAAPSSGARSPLRRQRSEEETKAQARAEVNVLAGLMGRAADGGGGGGASGERRGGDDSAEFTLQLFPDDGDGDILGIGFGSSVAESKVDTVRVDGNVGHKDAAKMMEELDLKDGDDDDRGRRLTAAAAKDHGDGADGADFDEMDMLALMDMAEEK